MNILVTGASGYLGQFLLESILLYFMSPSTETQDLDSSKQCNNNDINSIIRLGYTYRTTLPTLPNKENVESYQVDFLDSNSIENCISTFQPNIIVHCAANSSPANCEQCEPHELSMTNAPVNLLSSLQKANLHNSTIIYISTDQIYSGKSNNNSEKIVPNPVNAYGKSKLEFEQKLLELWQNIYILRSSNIIGGVSPYTKSSKFLQWLDSKMKQNEESITLFSDELRNFVYVKDICQIINKIIEKKIIVQKTAATGGEKDENDITHNNHNNSRYIYNMGGPEQLSRVDLAEKLCHVKNYNLTLSPTPTSLNNENNENEQRKIIPTLRSSLDLGYTSPLDITMNSNKLCIDFDFKFTTMEEAIHQIYFSS